MKPGNDGMGFGIVEILQIRVILSEQEALINPRNPIEGGTYYGAIFRWLSLRSNPL